MNAIVVLYNLADDQDPSDFETWLREVDMPGYAKLKSLRNPAYFRMSGLLGEDGPAPYRYVVVIESTGPGAVEDEMAAPQWAGFIADFEGRTKDRVFAVAEKLDLG